MNNRTEVMALAIEEDIFRDARLEFNDTIQELVADMDRMGINSGSVTLKINLSMLKARNVNHTTGEVRDFTKMEIEYKINSSIKMSSKAQGEIKNENTLIFDRELGKYILLDPEASQERLF